MKKETGPLGTHYAPDEGKEQTAGETTQLLGRPRTTMAEAQPVGSIVALNAHSLGTRFPLSQAAFFAGLHAGTRNFRCGTLFAFCSLVVALWRSGDAMNFQTKSKFVRATLALLMSAALAASALGQVSNPLLRDRDPLLPDAFNPPRSLVFVTRDDPSFLKFVGPQRPAVLEAAPQGTLPPPQGIEAVDSNEADRDGYVEYFDGASYVAELKNQHRLNDRAAKDQADALTFHGTVRGIHSTHYQGLETPHQLLRVEHKNGRSALVDVGPVSALERLQLRTGDVVSVVARPGLINDRPALIADEINVGEAKIKVIRKPSVRQ